MAMNLTSLQRRHCQLSNFEDQSRYVVDMAIQVNKKYPSLLNVEWQKC